MQLRLYEPAVALTDLLVGVEAGLFAVSLARLRTDMSRSTSRARKSKSWFVLFFAATSMAALAGAVLHGLVPPSPSMWRRRLWRLSLGSIGVAAFSAWCVASVIALRGQAGARVRRGAIVTHGLYLAWLTRAEPPYVVAVGTYLPGAVALTAALVRGLTDRSIRTPAATALLGLGMTFAAAVVQMRRLAVHSVFFNHNATYHTIQAVAVVLLHRAARGFVDEPPTTKPSSGQLVGRR